MNVNTAETYKAKLAALVEAANVAVACPGLCECCEGPLRTALAAAREDIPAPREATVEDLLEFALNLPVDPREMSHKEFFERLLRRYRLTPREGGE